MIFIDGLDFENSVYVLRKLYFLILPSGAQFSLLQHYLSFFLILELLDRLKMFLGVNALVKKIEQS